MEKLFDVARLADYRPGDPWFDAIEAFGEDAVVVLRETIVKEPSMEEVLTRPRGKSHVRRSIVVRQGGRTLAVVKPRSRQSLSAVDDWTVACMVLPSSDGRARIHSPQVESILTTALP